MLLQLPGWFVVGGLAWLARGGLDLPAWAPWTILGLWIAKDALLFPFLRVAYEDGARGGTADLLGSRAVVTQALEPEGWVRIGAELWRAELATPDVRVGPGEPVRIRAVDGLRLIVEREATPEQDAAASRARESS